MHWLLWREYRLNRLILGVAAFLLIVPYAVVAMTVSFVELNVPNHVSPWAPILGGAATYSVVLNQLTFALLGGNAFAGERRDGSAEFLAYLPVSRARRIASKLLLTLITAAAIWGLNALIVAPLIPYLDHRMTEQGLITCLFVAVTGVTFFCVSWLVSSFQSSATFAVAAGLVAPCLLLATLQFIAWLLAWEPLDQRAVAAVYFIGCGLMALVSFPVGTWYFLRRIEP